MHSVSHWTSLLVLTGAIFMVAAILLGRKTRGYIPGELSRRWRLMIGLMYFFLAGYLFFAAILLSHLTVPTEIITGPVFLGGAVFVFIVINLTRQSIARLGETEGTLKRLNESLEQRVEERTKELDRSHAFLRTVIDSLNDSVAILDVDTYTIVDANAVFLKETGRHREEVIGQRCYGVTHGRSDLCGPPDDLCPLLETVAGGRHARAEHVHRCKTGGTRHVEVSTSPIRDQEGRITQVVHVTKDITAEKRAKDRLERYASALEMTNEDLQSFIFSLSHDLRSPLVNIKGFSLELVKVLKELDELMNRPSAELSPQDRGRLIALVRSDIPHALQFIGGSVDRINGLVNAVLKLAHLGQMELRPETVDMAGLLRAGLDRFAEETARRGIEVAVGDLPGVVADRGAMQEAVGHLLDNAFKYLNPDRPGRIQITGQRHDGEVRYHIRDNGRGIAPDDLPKVFGLFRRGGAQDLPGDGMGLAYVKALVRRHGGRVWCESEAGKGTMFSFSIPDSEALAA